VHLSSTAHAIGDFRVDESDGADLVVSILDLESNAFD
jgi:hypothetical protein